MTIAPRRLHACLIALLLVMPASHAQNRHADEHPFRMPGAPEKTVPAPSPWLTGAQLLQRLDPPAVASASRQATIDGAISYLMGVYDSSESGLWCYTDNRPRPTPKQLPEAMRTSAVAYLRKLSPKGLQEKAAVLVVQMWREKWPCPPEGCCVARGY